MDFQEFQDFAEFSKRCKKLGPKRYLRDYADPFTKYTSEEFYNRYNFSPWVVKDFIIPWLEPDLRKPTKRGLPFAPEIMVLITLRYYATGNFQKLGGDVMNICQQSVSRIIAEVSIQFAKKMRGVVKFPSASEEIRQIKQKFYEIAEFPEVVGCIGCTHVKIRRPGGEAAEVYKNRKGWYSVKVQAVAGPDLQFYNLVARWPGTATDNVIYNSSLLKESLEGGNGHQGILVGGNGYEVSSVLMTPFSFPSNAAQERYNTSHSHTRNVVGQAFEVWKRRFHCLQVGMAMKLKTVVAVICACAALHNLAIAHNDVLSPTQHIHHDDEDIVVDNPSSSGSAARDYLVQNFFEYRTLA